MPDDDLCFALEVFRTPIIYVVGPASFVVRPHGLEQQLTCALRIVVLRRGCGGPGDGGVFGAIPPTGGAGGIAPTSEYLATECSGGA